jgi:cytochrome c
MRFNFAAAAVAALTLLTCAPAVRADGDPTRGEQIYRRCQGCHSIDANRVGPRHTGLFGRRAGGLDDYN